MKIVTEKKRIAGTLEVSNGLHSFPVLMNGNIIGARQDHIGMFPGSMRFLVIDGEGFENWIAVGGSFLFVPAVVPEYQDVKVVLSEKEAQDLDTSELLSDEPAVAK